MRKTFSEFQIQYPSRKYRHEKPDIKVLLEKKETTYVDISKASRTSLLSM